MRLRFAVALTMIVVLVGCTPGPSSGPSKRSLAVRGTAKVAVEPDRVSFTVGVESQDPSVSVAFEKTTARITAVISALKERGVSAHEIQTSQMNVMDVRNRDRSLLGYRASNRITVTRSELTDVGELLQAAVDAGSNEIGSLRFFVEDVSAATDEGLRRAYEDARRKAEQLASLSGSTLGRVLSISDGTPVSAPTGGLRSLAYAADASISPGREELTFNVTVEFELE